MKKCLTPHVCGVSYHRDETVCLAHSKWGASIATGRPPPSPHTSSMTSSNQFRKLADFTPGNSTPRGEISGDAKSNYGIANLPGLGGSKIEWGLSDGEIEVDSVDSLGQEEFEDIYESGQCFSLAAALSQRIGNGVVIFGDNSHVAAIFDNEHYIDSKGIHDINDRLEDDQGRKTRVGDTEDVLHIIVQDTYNWSRLPEVGWEDTVYEHDGTEKPSGEFYCQNWGLGEDAADRVLRENEIDLDLDR